MKLKNKKTGEIKDTAELMYPDGIGMFFSDFDSLAELNEEWEDYEEPKEYWYIDYDGGILLGEEDNSSAEKMMISIGNRFDSLEEAEKAVEKLMAWKRLKDKGFEINDWAVADNYEIRLFGYYSRAGIKDELDLLFGGEG